MCEEKIFQLQSMSDAIIDVNQYLDAKNSGASCLTLIFGLRNPTLKTQLVKNCKTGTCAVIFIWPQTCSKLINWPCYILKLLKIEKKMWAS